MKISICIPTYNGEAYLCECLDSCISQDFNDYEILVVDDCSSDKTLEICERYQRQHAKIKVHQNKENLGLVGNWNKCIELANGEWIKFVFQDDYLSKDCLTQFLKRVTSHSQLLVSRRSFILPEYTSSELKKYYTDEVRTFDNLNYIQTNGWIDAKEIARLAVENICLNFIAEPSLALFKKEIVKEIGPFNSDFAQICDLDFFQRLGSSFGLVYIPEKLCHFRIHASSTTSANLGAKAYVLSNLEPVLLAHQMLFNKHYKHFRDALSTLQLAKLKLYFSVRTYEAGVKSKLNSEHQKSFNQLADKFVEIKKRESGDWFTKLAYLLIQVKRIYFH